MLIVLEQPGLYALKPRFQNLLRPLAAFLASVGIRANQVTLFACILSVALGSCLLIARDPRLFALLPAVLLIRMALNAIDGILAREFSQRTRLGIFLNELTDVVSDTFLYLPFAHITGFSPFWVWNVVLLAAMTEMTGTVAVMAGATRRYDGPMGKSDRAFLFAAMGLWIGLTGGVPVALAYWFPRILVTFLLLTIINRVNKALKE